MNIEYVFHGSPTKDIAQLEPRQAHNGSQPDGEPAVHAAQNIETAIFMALIGGNKWGGWNSQLYPGLGFWMHERYLDAATNPEHEGHVYVLPVESFDEQELTRTFPRAYEPVSPIGSFVVSASDLPNITIVSQPYSKPYTRGRWPII